MCDFEVATGDIGSAMSCVHGCGANVEDIDDIETPRHPAPSFIIPSCGLSSVPPALPPLLDMGPRAASSSFNGHGRRRGERKTTPKIPCESCVKRASEQTGDGSIGLCAQYTSALHRPRGKKHDDQSRQPTKKLSAASINTAPGASTDTLTVPWSDNGQEQHALQFSAALHS
jgi:hypothetical protein